MDFVEHVVRRDQHRIYAREYTGDEPSIVLMHGFPENLHLYDRLVPHLSERRVVTFDFLGWGASDKPLGYPYTAENQEGDLHAVIKQLKLGQVVLVAHDASGPPAINWALQHPNQISALVLLNTYYCARAETIEGCPKRLFLYSRSQFAKEVLWGAYNAEAVIVGCNLVFDLTRLAVEYRISRRRNTGWSLVLFRYYNRKKRKWLPNTYRPRIKINPKDSRDAFINFAGGDAERPFRRGRFLNLLTLAWALRNERHGLQSACKEWRVEGKLNHKPTGNVTIKEIKYCRQDVRATVNLLNAMKAEYDNYPVRLQPERAHSPASIAKAYLHSMGLKEPARKYSVPDKIQGIAMQGYYGGRSEIRIRHTTVPVVYCDFTSEYPTVNALLGIWPQFIAKDLNARDCTRDVRNLMRNLTLSRLFHRDYWPQLAFFARVKPEDDVLPVRTVYGDTGTTNIGLNPLTSPKQIWYAGPDLAASKLLTGRTPPIEKAVSLVSEGMQRGLKSTVIGNRTIDPSHHNFFTAVIEARKGFPAKHPMNHFLKILANAGGYGMYAELNREDFGKNSRKRIRVYSGEDHCSPKVSTTEIPGPWYFPPVASLITAGGRLLVAMLERTITKAGGTYMMCDTDSMGIVSTKRGGLVPCVGGLHKLPDGSEAVKALPGIQLDKSRRGSDS